MSGVPPIVLDGELRPDGRVPLLALDSALQTAHGLFETLPLVGSRPAFLDRHCRRLAAGARELGLPAPPGPAVWEQDLRLLVRACGRGDLAVRLLFMSDGDAARRVAAGGPLPDDADRAAEVGLVEPRLQGPRTLAHIKSFSYLVPSLARRAAASAGLDEVLFTLADGTVLEGTHTSVFMVQGGVLRTAPLSLPILPGVTREVVLEEARSAGMPVEERAFTVHELREAAEVFLTSSLRGVRPVSQACGAALPRAPGPLTGRLMALFERRAASHDGSPPGLQGTGGTGRI